MFLLMTNSIKDRFDKACAEFLETGPNPAFGEQSFMIPVFVKMHGVCPNQICIENEGYYLNPDADDLNADEDEYVEDDPIDAVFKYDAVLVQKTFCNFVEKFKDTAYIVRNDEYPIIIGEDFMIYWSAYTQQIYVLQIDIALKKDIADCVVDSHNGTDDRWFAYVTMSSQGFAETSMKVRKQDVVIDEQYNDDLPHEKIVNFLKSNESGLLLLHGLPGSGKTTYIRHIMTVVKGRPFIVLDSSVFAYITDSSFINLLMENRNAVIILEDCETMLEDRESGNSQLTTLLNLSDGIIGDSVNFKLICTFNATINKIDKAVLRKGRMKLKYEFKELCKEKTIDLLNKLGVEFDEKDIKPMTLSDIYNYGESNGGEKANNVAHIGFGK